MTFRMKTILGIAAIELVLLAILILSGIQWLRDSNESQLVTSSERLSSMFAVATRDAIIATDLANLRVFANEALEKGDIVYIRIRNSQGRSLAHAGTELKGTVDYSEKPSMTSDGIYDVRSRVTIDGIDIGQIEFGLDVSAFSQLLVDAKKFGVALASLEMVLVALFSFFLGTYLTKQLNRLKRAAADISKHGPGTQVEIESNDEIGQVARAFNHMSSSLEHSYTELSVEKDKYESLATQYSVLAEIVQQSHESFLIADIDGKIIWSNHAFSALSGMGVNECIGHTISEILHHDDPYQASISTLDFALNSEQSTVVKVKCFNNKKEDMWTEISLYPIKNTQQKVIRFTYIIRDISERHHFEMKLKQALAEAQSATKAKSIFLANMSHEIRTPMNGIIGMSEMLQETRLSDDQRQFVDVVSNSAKDLLLLINDILDYSKIDAGKLVLFNAPFSLRDLLEESICLASSKAADKQLSLVCDIDPALPTYVNSDKLRLRQIITNLLNNAVKFTDSGFVKVSLTGKVTDDKTHYHLTVEDSGIGIPESKISGITNAFEQADGSTSRRYEGTGLGLSITSGLLKLFGAEMTITSTENQGSRFSFDLILPSGKDPEENYQAGLSGIKIAVINADPLHRPILEKYLNYWQSGFEFLSSKEQWLSRESEFDAAIIFAPYTSEDNNIPYPSVYLVDSGTTQPKQPSRSNAKIVTKPLKTLNLCRVIQAVIAPESNALQSEVPGGDIESSKDAHSQVSILVAEDNQYNRDVIAAMLKNTSTKATFVENATDALTYFKGAPQDILLTDISMPDMDGYELTSHVREFERKNNLVPCMIIGLSAHAGSEDANKAIESGMDSYLTKPISKIELINSLDLAAKVRQKAKVPGN